MSRRFPIAVSLLVLMAVIVFCPRSHADVPGRIQFKLPLKRGDFTVYRFVPIDPKYAKRPLAVVIYGSGDGGFDGSEDNVGHALQAAGYEMLGFDCSAYANTDYDLDTLQADITAIAQSSLKQYQPNPPPLILGGWSMGANQAVAAAGGPHPPPGIIGLLLLSAQDRGRYGLRTADRVDISPTGPGTFALEDFGPSLGNIRVAEWNAGWDPFSSSKWLRSLTSPHQEFTLKHAFHDYDGFNDHFMKLLLDSVNWIMSVATPADPNKSAPKPSAP